jgi:hypothetical protein
VKTRAERGTRKGILALTEVTISTRRIMVGLKSARGLQRSSGNSVPCR